VPKASVSHLVLIPSYNTGYKVFETVRAARTFWDPVWVVVDGSTDGTAEELVRIAQGDPGLEVFVLPHNSGKGAAVLRGLREAAARGFTHALTMDADDQHPADLIPQFISASQRHPRSLILGKPVFGSEAPRARVLGRKLSNAFTDLETLWAGIGDSLFGFRVYPVRPLLDLMESTWWMRRFDFDAEAVVRLVWNGFAPLNLPAPVRYWKSHQGGVSHFNYVRDNALLISMHLRLLFGFLVRLPTLLARRVRPKPR